jgi:peptide/nickel transport system substrate-binding protein
LIDAARLEVDEEARMKLWHAAERVLYEDQPYTFLLRVQTLAFLDNRLKNLEVNGLGLNLLRVPPEIYVPADLQRPR